MKKILTFIPLGVGISAAIIYILNVIQFKIINNGTALLQILMTLKIYLFISIGGFALYIFIKVLDSLTNKNKQEQEKKTGHWYQPFMLRYVGVKTAKIMHDSGKGMEQMSFPDELE